MWVAAVESGLAQSAQTMRALTLAAHMAHACGRTNVRAHATSIATSTGNTAVTAPSVTAAAVPTRRASKILHRTVQSSKQPTFASAPSLQKAHLPPALLRVPPSIEAIDAKSSLHVKSVATLDDSFVAAEAAAEAEAEAEADMVAKAGADAWCGGADSSVVPSPAEFTHVRQPALDVHEPPPPPPAYPPPATVTATVTSTSAPSLALRELSSPEVNAQDKQLLAALEASRAEVARLQERVLDGSQRLSIDELENLEIKPKSKLL